MVLRYALTLGVASTKLDNLAETSFISGCAFLSLLRHCSFCDAKSKFIVTCKSDFLTIDLFPALRCSRAQLWGAKSSSSWRLPSNSTSRPPNT
ncbi:unnamed protein product [Cuscuta campestris]|uniref:Uncharacterized protein n=1 Tax=Cuscuta campestris TaxID=132261 RepID=A0A484L3I7_9ASTE|nr:unnamed protein product [Cuscuta campestris]